MKKSFILVTVALVAILSSCKKDYTCECKFPDGSVESAKFLETSKSIAKSNCLSQEGNASSGGFSVTYKITCELK